MKAGKNGVAMVSVPIATLNPAPYNPRRMTEKQVKDLTASITKFGLVDPLIVNRHPDRMNIVVGGHQRLNIARILGMSEVPCVFVRLDEEAERELNLRLNRNTGEWDWDLLADHFDIPLLQEVGFTDDELAKHFDLDGGETPTDADVVPNDAPARVATGDVWTLGKHTLVCGDSVANDLAIKAALGGALADCTWTDPPYNVAYQTKLSKEEAVARNRRKDGLEVPNDDMDDKQFAAFLRSVFGHVLTHSKPGAGFYVAHADVKSELFRAALRESGWELRQVLIWNKDVFVMGRQDYHWKHEPILYSWKDGKSHRWFGDRDKSTVFDVPRPKASPEHPTMKPVELVRQMVANSTMPNELVLDPFAGSGSTLVACEAAGRRAAVVELAPRYCDVILARWERLSGGSATCKTRAKAGTAPRAHKRPVAASKPG